MLRLYLKILWLGQHNSARDSNWNKNEKKTEKEVGRQYRGLKFGESVRAVENRDVLRRMVKTSSVVPQRPSSKGTEMR